MSKITYRESGVDFEIAKRTKDLIAPHARSTLGPEVIGDFGLFGGLFHLNSYTDPVLVSSTDGVGTKLKIASWLGRYDTIGKDVVNQNINDVLTTGARPIFFLDYLAMESLVPEQVEEIVKGIAEACKDARCALLGGETSQLSNVFQPGAFELAGFVVGAVEKSNLIDPSSVCEGDVLIGLPSSGLHTNGYSLVRAIFDLENDQSPLFEYQDELGCTLGESLLAPHRSYWPLVEPVLASVKSIAHITGSGIIENLERVMSKGLTPKIDWSSWTTPSIFQHIQDSGDVDVDEMRKVFNMGVGLILVCDPSQATGIVKALSGSWILGEVTST